eukprot:6718247-Pyramimonas_sp.AAC.2
MVEGLVVGGVADELLLARAGAHRAVRHFERHPGLFLKHIHKLPEVLGRVGRAGAVKLVSQVGPISQILKQLAPRQYLLCVGERG